MSEAVKRAAGKLPAALLLAALLLVHPALCEGEEGRAEGGASAAAGTGTAVLLGAGAYTGLRMHFDREKRKREQDTPGYVTFENHTKNGTLTEEEKRVFKG